ncbi:tyrosine-type recombinase/integrase [Vibrio chaetopteri]|uniref:tyrosine-type recombinase/integrase n=1 Tax=Vibrio chaetopteri TaxID=3016528 RepID=UPI003AB8551F
MTEIGVEARRKNRLNQIERVNQKAQQVFEKYFPNPVIVPKPERFYDKWAKFIDEITNTFGRIGDYRRAFNIGVKNVLSYQKLHNWKVNPPSYIVTKKSPKPLRTLDWMQSAWKGYEFYQHWYYDELLKSPAQSKEQAFRNLILSFIYHSGHANPDVVDAFQRLIANSNVKVSRWNDSPFISVIIDSKRFNTNVDVAGNNVTQFHCYLHPITLGLLRLWKRWRRQSWQAPKDKGELGAILTRKQCDLTFSQLCQTSVYVVENQSDLAMSHALTEYQVSKTKSYALPVSNLARLIHPMVYPLTDINFTSGSASSDSKVSAKKTKPKSQHLELFDNLKACLQPKGTLKPVSRATLKQSLETLITEISSEETINQRLLIQWYRHKLDTCSVGTLKAYHSSLTRKWLYLCERYPLNTLNGEELEQIYKQTIDNHTTDKSKKYFAGRLKDLHAFAVETNVLTPISSDYLHTDPTQAHTRAAFVDEALFTGLLNGISSAKGLGEADKLCLKSMCILSYRCGLRLNELAKLRIKDIEPSNIGWLSVRDNHLGTNKTAASLRKVPLYPMLLKHETKVINDYYHIKQEQQLGKKHPFFSFGADAKLPVDNFRVSMLVGELLKSLSQLNYFVFHHLRHSCLSRLQLILEIDNLSTLPPQLSPYDRSQLEKIKGIVFGRSAMNGYDAIAAMAGHESPRMTFEHYFHFSDWIVAQKLKDIDFSLPEGAMSQVGLLPQRVPVEKRLKRYVLPYLMKTLTIQELSTNIDNGIVPTLHIEKDKEIRSVPICRSALEFYQQGFSHDDICSRLRITEATLNKWISNAKHIKAFSTESAGQQYSRHFSNARSKKLLPSALKTSIEIKTQNQYIKELKEHFQHHHAAIVDTIAYALKHASVSRTGIHFNSPIELNKFLETTHLFIPKAHWLAATQYLDSSIKKSEWLDALKGIRTYKERKPSGRSKKAQGAVRLELVHPSSRMNNESKTKQSSPLLLHLFHMMGIMMMNLNSEDETAP